MWVMSWPYFFGAVYNGISFWIAGLSFRNYGEFGLRGELNTNDATWTGFTTNLKQGTK